MRSPDFRLLPLLPQIKNGNADTAHLFKVSLSASAGAMSLRWQARAGDLASSTARLQNQVMQHPVFGTLACDIEMAEWTAKLKIPELVGFQIPPRGKRRTTSFGVSVVADNRREPGAEQSKAFAWLLAHETSLRRNVVRAVVQYYSWLRICR